MTRLGPARARRQPCVPEEVGGVEAEQQAASRALRGDDARPQDEHERDVRCADQGTPPSPSARLSRRLIIDANPASARVQGMSWLLGGPLRLELTQVYAQRQTLNIMGVIQVSSASYHTG